MKKKNYQFQDIASEWITLHSVGIKAGSIKMYEQKINQLNEYFCNVPIKDITYLDLQRIINEMFKANLKKSTMHKTKITMGLIFKYAMKTGLISTNPSNFVELPKNAKTTERVAISNKQIEIILKNIREEFGLYPFMLLFLGLRRSELLPLKFEDIDFVNKQVRICKIVNYIKNKPLLDDKLKNGNKERFIAIPDILLEYLKNYKREKGYIFNRNGKILLQSQLVKCWKDYQSKTGFDGTQHMIRHTYATMLFSSDVDIKTAQYLMGHNDVRTLLQIYIHLEEEKKQRNISKFNSYINDNLVKRL